MKYIKKMRYNDDEEEYSSVKDADQRRPVRNWTKLYSERKDEIDEYDEFHKYRIKS